MSPNPYQTPVDSSEGQYDYSLRRRMIRAAFVLVAYFALISSGILWQHYQEVSRNYRSGTTWEKIVNFFSDWKHSSTP